MLGFSDVIVTTQFKSTVTPFSITPRSLLVKSAARRTFAHHKDLFAEGFAAWYDGWQQMNGYSAMTRTSNQEPTSRENAPPTASAFGNGPGENPLRAASSTPSGKYGSPLRAR